MQDLQVSLGLYGDGKFLAVSKKLTSLVSRHTIEDFVCAQSVENEHVGRVFSQPQKQRRSTPSTKNQLKDDHDVILSKAHE